MRIGVYVDGYNLYYGGRGHCGRGKPGWRWLDVRALASTLVAERTNLLDAHVHRVVYCTARVDGVDNPSGHADQDVYLKALLATGSVDRIEYGHYVARVKYAPLARTGRRGRPELVHPAWPVMVKTGDGTDGPEATFMISYAHREEKGSDVNVAAHLLIDVLDGRVDATMVISNDSDLSLPIRFTRERVPVGVINPGTAYIAGELKGAPSDGVGRHWWRQLRPSDFTAHQLPTPAGPYRRPAGW